MLCVLHLPHASSQQVSRHGVRAGSEQNLAASKRLNDALPVSLNEWPYFELKLFGKVGQHRKRGEIDLKIDIKKQLFHFALSSI